MLQKNRVSLSTSIIAVALGFVVGPASAAGITTFTDTGSIAGITDTVNNFRSSLGALNPNVVGSFGSGRREINWDGVPDARAGTVGNLPGNFFNVNSPRGVVMSTPGTGFSVSEDNDAPPDADPDKILFDHIRPGYSAEFQAFSQKRIFTALDSTVTDIKFFVPGSNLPGAVKGFGVVFNDVEIAGGTTIEAFDGSLSLGTFAVPADRDPDNPFMFLGLLGDANTRITGVRINTGTVPLSATAFDNFGDNEDVAVMDDFIYGEPVHAPDSGVPAGFAVAAIGALGWLRRRS